MSILPLIISPDPLLKQVAKEVEKVDAELQKLMDDMLQTMYHEKGIGLAAVQVGVLKRILVMDVNYESGRYENQGCGDSHCEEVHVEDSSPIYMVNPKIIKSSAELSTFSEGCLSFPEIRAEIKRPEKVEVEYLDYHGKKQILKADGILATCVQHEIDHLNGITFVDYLSKTKREMLLKKMGKLLRSRL